jgi:hypothetical protein
MTLGTAFAVSYVGGPTIANPPVTRNTSGGGYQATAAEVGTDSNGDGRGVRSEHTVRRRTSSVLLATGNGL